MIGPVCYGKTTVVGNIFAESPPTVNGQAHRYLLAVLANEAGSLRAAQSTVRIIIGSHEVACNEENNMKST